MQYQTNNVNKPVVTGENKIIDELQVLEREKMNGIRYIKAIVMRFRYFLRVIQWISKRD
jgi:hypothetical protein